MEGKNLLCPKEVATILGVSVGTLANWRVEDNFKFQWIKIGGLVRYEWEEVKRFIDSRKIKQQAKNHSGN
jgi:predicted site-specific integrase-resolvase